jgi:MYXO-CTERM domain-containing protein
MKAHRGKLPASFGAGTRLASSGSVLRVLLAALVVLAAVLRVSPASAAGTVQIKNLQPEEVDGRWKLNMQIDYGAVPHLNHIPMIFQFEMTTLYERALTDQGGDKPQLVRKPLSNQSPINESMDVGFSDGSGKTFKITKFDFVVRRDRGFEAGEYTLKIKRAGDGVAVGTPQKITLKGDNPIVDRRAIVFSGEKKKPEGAKTQEGDKASASDKAADKGTSTDPEKDAPADNSPAENDPAPETVEPGGGVPPTPPRQGGCGCRVAGDAGAPAPLVLLGLAAGLASLRLVRRRR